MLAIFLVFAGVVMRLLPHAANFTPIAAIALFGAVYMKRGYGLLLPLAAVVISDLAIGFDSLQSRMTVYGSFLLIGLIGLAIRKRKSIATVVLGSLSGSVVFYLITNLAYLYSPTMYPHSLNGVLSSYYNALPFFRNSLVGDLFYTGLLFGLYELARYVAKQRSKVSTLSARSE